MLQPMRTKFRKAHKGRIKGLASSAVDLAFGQFGLKAMEPERVSARQIEAARRRLTACVVAASAASDLAGSAAVERWIERGGAAVAVFCGG